MTDVAGDLQVRAGADDFQPPLTRWGHTWRLLLMVAISAVVVLEHPLSRLWADQPGRVVFDLVVGAVAFGLVHLRRRHPLAVALAVVALGTVSATAAGPAVLGTVSAATRRVPWQLAVLAVANVATMPAYQALMPDPGTREPFLVTAFVTVAFTGAALAWGMYVGSRRELLWTLRQRAERAEAERDLRVGKAQADERGRIAREMHDVLAHRISQISMHAGALSFRTDLDAADLRAGIGEVQARANEALADLRSVLGVLRDPASGEIIHQPQPTYHDVALLIDQARAAGARVELAEALPVEPLPAGLGRTLYRIVQEGITNAHKHAPGALLTVQIAGDDDRGVEVLLRNPLGFGRAAPPGAGLGLVGLVERVQLAGGQLTAGRDGACFVVRATLPWAA